MFSINMRLAENNMLHDEIGNFIHDQVSQHQLFRGDLHEHSQL